MSTSTTRKGTTAIPRPVYNPHDLREGETVDDYNPLLEKSIKSVLVEGKAIYYSYTDGSSSKHSYGVDNKAHRNVLTPEGKLDDSLSY